MTPYQRRLLARSLVLLPLAAALLRLQGLGWIQRRTLARPAPPTGVDVSSRLRVATEAAEVVDLAARRGPWRANCLQRSTVLWRELNRRGVDADLRIGVRAGDTSPAMHAWVEVDGRIVNDRPDVASRFSPFREPILPPGARFD